MFRSAQFLNTDHRMLVATLKLRLKSARLPASQPKLDVSQLRDETVATEFASRLAGQFQELPQGTAEEMWDFFKTTTLSTASGVLGIRKCTRRSFVSNDTLDLIDKSRRARLDSLPDARELRRKTLRSLRADKEDYVRSICERVEHHLWSSDSGPAHLVHPSLSPGFVQSRQAVANY